MVLKDLENILHFLVLIPRESHPIPNPSWPHLALPLSAVSVSPPTSKVIKYITKACPHRLINRLLSSDKDCFHIPMKITESFNMGKIAGLITLHIAEIKGMEN